MRHLILLGMVDKTFDTGTIVQIKRRVLDRRAEQNDPRRDDSNKIRLCIGDLENIVVVALTQGKRRGKDKNSSSDVRSNKAESD